MVPLERERRWGRAAYCSVRLQRSRYYILHSSYRSPFGSLAGLCRILSWKSWIYLWSTRCYPWNGCYTTSFVVYSCLEQNEPSSFAQGHFKLSTHAYWACDRSTARARLTGRPRPHAGHHMTLIILVAYGNVFSYPMVRPAPSALDCTEQNEVRDDAT